LFLRSLSLLGFKTFARSTEIRFEGGVTAIVGPNGSGKTNIVDSIKWVLGSGQARDLRGRKMEEVIYAGGERRSRAAFAEVTVVFDNTAGRLPVDYHEVAIKRRVERDGVSDYFLNGTRVRRRDLIHLLSSTGLTVDSYAIIDQHDIESIVVCSAAERRQLLEEAAQVRGVKARRQEAAQRLAELAQNLLRLEDLKGEIEPRLEILRAQAATAREAAEAQARLEVLRGSILWEEWREARDAHRRAAYSAHSLERRLVEAREQTRTAESEFQVWRSEVQAAQDRRFGRQRMLGQLRLELANAEHALQLAEERAQSQSALAASLRQDMAAQDAREGAARALRDQLAAERDRARTAFDAVPASVSSTESLVDVGAIQGARRAAEQARRALAAASSSLASLRTRRDFLEEQLAKLVPLAAAAGRLPEAEAALAREQAAAGAAEAAAFEVARLRAELEGLEALRAIAPPGAVRLGDVLTAEAGYEAALSAVLGALADALVAADEASALEAAAPQEAQRTVLYPGAAAQPQHGSLLHHVRVAAGYEAVARRLLGDVVVGRDVTLDGVFREPGLVRGGKDPRVEMDARRARLRERISSIEALAADATETAQRARRAAEVHAELRSQAAGGARLDETRRLLESARATESAAAAQLPGLESAAAAAEEQAAAMERELSANLEAAAEHRAAAQHLESERARWRDRVDDLSRQLKTVEEDLAAMGVAAESRAQRAAGADASARAALEVLPGLRAEVEAARARLAEAAVESPEEEAEIAEGARRLVALEEARIDARLKTGTLEGNLELISRETELLQARMDEIRTRMPDGVAPEDVPGGKAREREMRALERRLEEIGPTNALAESECRELEERYENLHAQLGDITAARADLEQLIEKLREEEESRYEAVFGAVAANFHEYF
jgi:chromosome segregation protein